MARWLRASWLGLGALGFLAAACGGGEDHSCAFTSCAGDISSSGAGSSGSSGSSVVPADYPAAPTAGAHFSLVVAGVPEEDSGGVGASFVDDPVASNRHYEIAAKTTTVSVPELDIGAYSVPTRNVLLTLGGATASDTDDSLTVSIAGNERNYVWGSLDGVLEGTKTSALQVTGKFSARISP